MKPVYRLVIFSSICRFFAKNCKVRTTKNVAYLSSNYTGTLRGLLRQNSNHKVYKTKMRQRVSRGWSTKLLGKKLVPFFPTEFCIIKVVTFFPTLSPFFQRCPIFSSPIVFNPPVHEARQPVNLSIRIDQVLTIWPALHCKSMFFY